LSVEGKSEDWVKFKLDPTSDIEQTDEIKVAVVSSQRPKPGKPDFLFSLGSLKV
jgi:hypothetical protein